MNPPGWYPSPNYPDLLQYWDGAAWTKKIRPVGSEPDEAVEFAPAVQAEAPRVINVKPSLVLRILAALLLFAGGIPLTITGPTLAPTITGQAASYVQVTGSVVNIDYSTTGKTNGRRKQNCAAIAEFSVDGQSYRAKADVYTAPCAWQLGQDVKVSYDPANPSSTGVVDKSSAVTFTAWAFFAVGALLTTASLALFIKSFFLKGKKVR